jgi:hypothetical protein
MDNDNTQPTGNHVKPSQEELKANIQKGIDEIDQLDAEETKKVEEIVENADNPPADEKPIVVPQEQAQEEETLATEEETELKKKLSASARESQVLAARNKQFSSAVEEAQTLPEPTPEELKVEAVKKGFDFDLMSDVEQSLFKDSVLANKRLEKIGEVARAGKDVEEWNNKVDEYVGDPQTMIDNPRLEGKQEDFKLFSAKQSRRGVPFEDLVSSFLYNYDKEKPQHKGAMFERGTGGPSDKDIPKSTKISVDDAAMLREKDYNKFVEYLRAGKIETPTDI